MADEQRPTEQATVPETSSERLIEPRLPEIIHEPETPRITPGRAFRGLGSLIGPGSKLKAVKRLFTLAQQGYQLLPEELQLLGDVLDMEALTKPLPGTGVGLDYFRQMLGRVPPAPTSQEEREEPTGIATLEKSQEARRAYDEAMGITKNFEPTFEKLPGEWFLVEGQAEYAEGDIGEYNHEAIVRRNVLYKLADAANDFLDAGINLDDEYIDETTLEYIMAEQVEGAADPQAMMDKMGVTQKEIDVALGRSNATDYGIEELGYVRVAGNNLQLSGLTRSKMLEIANGLYDAVGDESIEGMTFNIEDSANGKFYKDVPFPVFSSGSMKALRDYDTAIVGMAEGGLVAENKTGIGAYMDPFSPGAAVFDTEHQLMMDPPSVALGDLDYRSELEPVLNASPLARYGYALVEQASPGDVSRHIKHVMGKRGPLEDWINSALPPNALRPRVLRGEHPTYPLYGTNVRGIYSKPHAAGGQPPVGTVRMNLTDRDDKRGTSLDYGKVSRTEDVAKTTGHELEHLALHNFRGFDVRGDRRFMAAEGYDHDLIFVLDALKKANETGILTVGYEVSEDRNARYVPIAAAILRGSGFEDLAPWERAVAEHVVRVSNHANERLSEMGYSTTPFPGPLNKNEERALELFDLGQRAEESPKTIEKAAGGFVDKPLHGGWNDVF